MIDKQTYEIGHIRGLQNRYVSDPGMIERSLYAFGLLEAICAVGMPFCFKGGTSLMLILDHPTRLSTDIDILVEPGTDVDDYLDKAASIFPFVDKKEVIRKGKNGIEKRHFKFTYYSPVNKSDFFILLDIVFAHVPYAKTVQREIKNELLLTVGDNLSVEIPTSECILGDKMTAFAPHTTGILLGVGKELEIAKQLYDISSLSDYISDYELLLETYHTAVAEETAFRGETWAPEYVLRDTLRSCVSIISHGNTDKDDYAEYLRGIKSLRSHVLNKGYTAEDAVYMACRTMYLTSCILSGNPFHRIDNPEEYSDARLELDEYKKLAYVRKQNLTSYACLVEATRNLK